MSQEHTVRSYDEELAHLSNLIARMGGLAEAQLEGAVQALQHRDSDRASAVIAGDIKVDELEQEVHTFTVRLLALRQPVAQDLRAIVAALNISGDIERIADYAAERRQADLGAQSTCRPSARWPAWCAWAVWCRRIVKNVLDAFADEDVEKAIRVWRQDEEVDDIYTSLFRELLTYMMEDPRNITASIHLMFMAKNIERIGDHATNIAETIHFLVRGKPLGSARPKGELSMLPEPLPEIRDQ